MESKSRLKQRLARLFHASTLLRTPCNHSGSIFSSSAAGSASSRRSASTDIVVDPVLLRRNDAVVENPPFLTGGVDRSLSFPGRRLDCGGGCRPTRTSSERDLAKSVHYKKKERRPREPRCPPASPASPNNNNNNNNNHHHHKKKKLLSNGYGFSSSSSDEEYGFFSSDEEEEAADTFFSSRSFSSDSSGFYQRPSSNSKKKNQKKKDKHDNQNKFSSRGFQPVVSMTASRKKKAKEEEEGEGEETERGFPVTKRSKDPYVDFRDSMVEMIVEGQIFGAKGLEQLLHSYLSLNSPHHHPVILRAFADISEVLFGH